MILFVCVKLNEIYSQGREFTWTKPGNCPRCKSVRVWGHGHIMGYFDGFPKGMFLRRFRCPDCGCVIRMKPQGYFLRFQASIHKIRSCSAEHVFVAASKIFKSITLKHNFKLPVKRSRALLGSNPARDSRLKEASQCQWRQIVNHFGDLPLPI